MSTIGEMLIGSIPMHQPVLTSHSLFDYNNNQGSLTSHSTDFDNLSAITSVPHLYYCNRTIKQEIIRESDAIVNRSSDTNQSLESANCFPFLNKSRFSAYESSRILPTSTANMYPMKVS